MTATLFPYATTSRLQFWKTRVFDFSALSSASAPSGLPGAAGYEPFVPSIGVFPEYAQDDAPRRFHEEITGQEAARLAAFRGLLGFSETPKTDLAAHLDEVGRALDSAIEPASGMVRDSSLAQPKSLPELQLAPIWNAIAIDLGLYLAHCLKTAFPVLAPRWVAPKPRSTANATWDYPGLEVRVPTAPEQMDATELAFLATLREGYDKIRDPEALEAAWTDVLEAALAVHPEMPEDIYPQDYTPQAVAAMMESVKGSDTSVIYPFFSAKLYLQLTLLKQHAPNSLDSYYASHPPVLGDCLRPEAGPNWSGFVLPGQAILN